MLPLSRRDWVAKLMGGVINFSPLWYSGILTAISANPPDPANPDKNHRSVLKWTQSIDRHRKQTLAGNMRDQIGHVREIIFQRRVRESISRRIVSLPHPLTL